MISCTEFIPLYSEFFKFLEKRGGKKAVMDYWIHISDSSIGDLTNPNSLGYKCEKLGGFEGAIAYWGHTLTEEACDIFEMEDRKARVKYSHMRHCPSRGMLNALTHVTPYHDYCEHCNVIYSRVLEKYGIVYERDNSGIANAECREVFYEKGCKPNFDFKAVRDEDMQKRKDEDGVTIIDMKSEDNKYLHRDFHLLGDDAIKYCGDEFGKETVEKFLRDYVKYYYAPIVAKIKKEGLIAIKEWLENTYEIEEASDLIKTEITADKLVVTISKCPAITYMRTLKKEPSEYYIEQTRILYDAVAKESGYDFNLEYYDQDGGTKFSFIKK